MERDRRYQWEERHRSESNITAPSPFVVRALEHLGTRAARPRALDVACGRGRHALLLAAHGYDVDAVDFALPALAKLRAAALGRALPIRCLATDVRLWPLPPARYALVLVVNFLERALFPALRAAVAPGGALLYETHRRSDGDRSPPDGLRPEFLLAPGELEQLCHDWRVLLRHDDTSVHDGRTVARAGILAQRPHDHDSTATAH